VAGLLAGLPKILTDDAPGTFSAVPRVQVPSRAGEHRRRVEWLVSDETIERLPEPDVEELTRGVEVLAREEEEVSTNRRAVQRVVDLLRGELARRYRDGTAQVSQLLEE
jgi:RsiG-like